MVFCVLFFQYLFVFIVIKILVVLVHPVIIVYNILVLLSFILDFVLCIYVFLFYFDTLVLLRYIGFTLIHSIQSLALYLYIPLLCNCKTCLLLAYHICYMCLFYMPCYVSLLHIWRDSVLIHPVIVLLYYVFVYSCL